MQTGYLGTLLRFGCVVISAVLGMGLMYRLLRRLRVKENTAAGYSFLLPWIVGFAVFSLVPMGYSLFLSLTRYAVAGAPEWVGTANYARIFTEDIVFRDAVRNTLLFAAGSVGLGIVTSLGGALLLSINARLMGVWRALYYLPSVIPAVSTALLWRWIFFPDGLANGLLVWLGFEPLGWFNNPSLVVPCFIVMSLQGAFGNNMVIFLAKLRGIDVQLYEAASLDGAGLWKRFLHVTLPQLSPVLLYHVVMGIIGSLQIFTQPMFVETPGRSGLFYTIYIYRAGWDEHRMGYASALSWILFFALMLLTLMVFRLSKHWVSYEESDVLTTSESEVTRPRRARLVVWYGAVVAGAAVMLVPIFWMVSTSLKAPQDLFEMPPELLSLPLHWENYPQAWTALPFGRFLLNTLFITGLAMFGEVLGSAVAAYGFSRFHFPGRRVLFALMMAVLLIPHVVLMVPVFLIWRHAGLVGTMDPLVLGTVLGGTALFIFIAHQFMRTLPTELEEAARLDGASHPRVFLQIILPQCKGVLLVIALISFQAHWNDFLGPLLYLNQVDQYTMTLGLRFFSTQYMADVPRWHWMMAITTLMSIPTVMIFLIMQRNVFQRLRKTGGPQGP